MQDEQQGPRASVDRIGEQVNPYGAPAQPAGMPVGPVFDPREAYQDDITRTEPTAVVKAGAILTVLTGLITALVGLQLLATTVLHSSLERVPYLLLGAGPVTMFLGWKTLRTQGYGAIGATAMSGLLALGMGYWVLLTASQGYFSLLALSLPPLGVLGAVFAGLSVGHCRRADAARARLREAGIDMSF